MGKRFISTTSPAITAAGLKSGSKLAPQGATLLLIRGSGLFNYIPICFADKPVAFNQDVKAICAKEHTDPIFLHFWIETLRKKLSDNLDVTGIGAGKFNTDFLKSLPFPDVTKDKQEKIGIYAEVFDRKIELNRQMNETLEGMAQAIFRDWFVDFGPVRRKLSGITDPKNIMGGLVEDLAKAKELAALFPCVFGDDGLPAGWENQSVAKLSKLLKRGLAPKYADQGVVVINQRCIRNNWINFANARCHDDVKRDPKDRWLQIGDIVVNSTGVGTLGRVATVRVLSGKTTADSHVTIIRPDAHKISDVILALFLEYKEGEISTLGHGSTGQTELKPSIIGELEFALPPDEIQDFFANIVNPLRCKVAANYQENQTLAETRDYLLPKLMSGEVRVGDVAVKTEIKTKLSSVVPIGGDFFDSQSLPANDNQERDSVMVAGVIQVLQKYDGVVGNVKYQKGCYFVYRLMELPTRDFEKQAAGPYNTKIKEGGYRDAITNRYIRRARKNGYSGNIPASKISQIDQLISHYGLGEALAWVKTCLKDKNRDELELWATVDYAMVALQNRKITPTADSVRTYINNEPEWAAKLQRAAFSDTKIKQAIIDLNKLFPRAAVT